MIILMVFAIIDIFMLFFQLIALIQLGSDYPGLGYGQIGPAIIRLILTIIIVSLISKWLKSADTSADRILLMKAMKFGIINGVIFMVQGIIVICVAYNDYDSQGQGQIIGEVIGGFINALLNLWYFNSAKQFYTEKLKVERGGALI